MVYIPDDSDFSSFKEQCESLEGWHCHYNKAGITVWSQGQEESCTVQKIKVSPPLRAPRHTSALLQPTPNTGAWGLWPQKHFCSSQDAAWALCLPHALSIWTRMLLQRGNVPRAHPCVLTLLLPLLQTHVRMTLWRRPCWEPPGHEMGRWVPLPQPCHTGAHRLTSRTSRATLRVSDAPRAVPATLLPARGRIWDAVPGAVTPCCSHMAPVMVLGDPEHIKSGCGVREPHHILSPAGGSILRGSAQLQGTVVAFQPQDPHRGSDRDGVCRSKCGWST